MVLQNLLIWAIAAALVYYIAHGLSIHELIEALKRSNLPLFVAANVASFVIRWLIDTYLYAKLFSFFHARTTYREVLPASTAQYFLQGINVLVADGAMVLFLHQRKGVEWITAGWTMAFQGFVDATLMAAITMVLALLLPWSPIRIALPYAAGALLFFAAAAIWWMRGRSISRAGRWLRNRHGMRAFRLARPYHYAMLGLIRGAIYLSNTVGFCLYFIAFRVKVPLTAVIALSPALMFAQSAPVTPSGLGPLQIVIVDGFARFARRGELLAAALGVSIVQLLCRIPLGLGAAGTFARKVLTPEHLSNTFPSGRQPSPPVESITRR
jgi:Lysylphosphatidylglycerol synthase TM region